MECNAQLQFLKQDLLSIMNLTNFLGKTQCIFNKVLSVALAILINLENTLGWQRLSYL